MYYLALLKEFENNYSAKKREQGAPGAFCVYIC